MKKVTSRAENPSARLGLITRLHTRLNPPLILSLVDKVIWGSDKTFIDNFPSLVNSKVIWIKHIGWNQMLLTDKTSIYHILRMLHGDRIYNTLQSLPIKHFKGLSKFCSSLQLFQEVFHLPHDLNSLQEKHTFYSAMTKIYILCDCGLDKGL